MRKSPSLCTSVLYPLMQGRDSVEIRADVELGGTEQLFNLMVGRDLQKDAGQEPQVCLTLPILRGLDGERRMGKSLGNYIGVGEPAYDMFAKTMSVPDALMRDWFELLTERPAEGSCPTHQSGTGQSQRRQDHARQGHRDVLLRALRPRMRRPTNGAGRNTEKQDPTEIPEVIIPLSEGENGQIWIIKLLKLVNFASGTNEARRHIQQSAVTIGPNREKISDEKGETSSWRTG